MKWPRPLSAAFRLRKFVSWLSVLGTLVVGSFVAFCGFVLWDGRLEVWSQSRQAAQNLQLAVQQDVGRSFELYGLSLQGVLDGLKIAGIETMDRTVRQAVLFDRAATARHIGSVMVVGADGHVRYDLREPEVRPVDVSDREYYVHHRDDPSEDLFVGKPFLSRRDGEWALSISRRINAADGTFAGVGVITLHLSYFQELFARFSVGDRGSILLLRTDGALLARNYSAGQGIGEPFRGGVVVEHFKKEPTGYFEATSPRDGSLKSYTYGQVHDLPLVSVVVVALDDIYAVWKTKATIIGTLLLILGLTAASLAVLWRRRERDLSNQFHRFRTALNKMPHGVCMFDESQQLVVCNESYVSMYGLSREQVAIGTSLRDIIRFRSEKGFKSEGEREQYYQDRIAQTEADAGTRIYNHADGRIISVSHQRMPDGGWVSTHEDITDRTRFEERITHMAKHDALTGLPNRVLLRERLERMLPHSVGAKTLAILYLDLDGFKTINDTLGHSVGDHVLSETASRLRSCVRERDTIARLGGDEFAILINAEDPAHAAASLAGRILDALAEPWHMDGRPCIVGTSIGIAVAPEDGNDAETLLRNADLALYQAKSEGRGRYCFFAPPMNARLHLRRELEIDLREALRHEQFDLHFQPVTNIHKNRVTGFEALLRWEHPTRGMISPADFVPITEEIGIIVPIGEWVLRRACATAATWPRPLRVAVNLSALQFRNGNLVATIDRILAETGLSPRRLELEITESVLIRDASAVSSTLSILRSRGIRIALDDFGTGYSSLSYLRNFPLDKIKIDRSFIHELPTSPGCRAIVRAVAGLSRDLGLTIIAEGVETKEQLEAVRAEGCMEVQGYLLGRPMPSADVTAMLAGMARLPTAA